MERGKGIVRNLVRPGSKYSHAVKTTNLCPNQQTAAALAGVAAVETALVVALAAASRELELS